MQNTKHYTWQEDFTYDADITMVLGQRNDGKTFGLREQLLRDFRDNQERFSDIERHKDYIPGVAKNYFSGVINGTKDEKLKEWLDSLNTPCFRLANETYEIAPRLKSGKPDNKWTTIGYFTGLAIKQDAKIRTYENIRRVVMDEAIIEPEDLRYRQYLADEWSNLASHITSMSKSSTTNHKVSVYLLGNAVDLLNPIFQHLNIYEIPSFGRHRFNAGTKDKPVDFLLHMLDPKVYKPYIDNSDDLGSRMVRGKEAAAYTNIFALNTTEFIAPRPKSAQYEAGFIYRGEIYGVWTDYAQGLQYVSSKFVKGLNRPMFALTTQDNRVNYLAAKEARKALTMLIDNYSLGIVRFDSVKIREGVFRMFRDFGIK